MATVVNPIEQGMFSKLSARVVLIFAKVKKRRKDLSEKEKRMGDRIKMFICDDSSTEYTRRPDGTNGDVETFVYGPKDSPFAVVLTRFQKKDTTDYKTECLRLYKEVYKTDWKKKWKKFTEGAQLVDAEMLDVDVNPHYRIPK